MKGLILQIFTFSIICITSANSQSSFFSIGGGHTLSMAGQGSMFQGVESIYTNPAGITSVDRFAFDVGYERRYNLAELSTVSVAGVAKLGAGAIGVSFGRFGYSAYSESKIGLTYARKLSRKLSAGATFDFLQYRIDQYGNTGKFTFEVGAQYEISSKVSMGFSIFNPVNVTLIEAQEIPARMALGIYYDVSKKANLYAEVSKTIDETPEVRLGIEYELHPNFSLRGGGNISVPSLHFGPVFKMNNGLRITGGYGYDNRLGHTTAVSLTFDVN